MESRVDSVLAPMRHVAFPHRFYFLVQSSALFKLLPAVRTHSRSRLQGAFIAGAATLKGSLGSATRAIDQVRDCLNTSDGAGTAYQPTLQQAPFTLALLLGALKQQRTAKRLTRHLATLLIRMSLPGALETSGLASCSQKKNS